MSETASKPHVVDLDEMLEHIDDKASEWELYASAGYKRLHWRHAGGYRVTVHGKTLWQGTDGRTAVNRYNSAKQ